MVMVVVMVMIMAVGIRTRLPGWLGGGGRGKKETAEYAIISCIKCGAVQKRAFEAGDYVFAEIRGKGACAACGGDNAVTVERIFSEDAE